MDQSPCSLKSLLGRSVILQTLHGRDSLMRWRIKAVIDSQVRLVNLSTGKTHECGRSHLMDLIESGAVRLD